VGNALDDSSDEESASPEASDPSVSRDSKLALAQTPLPGDLEHDPWPRSMDDEDKIELVALRQESIGSDSGEDGVGWPTGSFLQDVVGNALDDSSDEDSVSPEVSA
jgi:hypothetical protein